ncbi:MAG: molecular chaperone [Candidatus Hydrothermarchaeales archaeon]
MLAKPREKALALKGFIELAGDRAETYRFFAALYSYQPIEQIARAIRDKSILEGLSGSGKGFKLIKEYVENAQKIRKLKDLVEELQVEHTSLFVIPKYTVGRPYESFYMDREKKIGARVTIEVENFMKRAGVEFTEARDEIADYIALELEFMAFLCGKEEEQWKAGDKEVALTYLNIERDFLKNHLGKWIEPFCDDIASEPAANFFKGVAMITKDFVKLEYVEIDDLLDDAKKLKVKKKANA